MKSFIFCGLFLALIMSCRAGGKRIEEMNAMKEKMCKPELETATVKELMKCKGDFGGKWLNKMFDTCKGDGEKDLATYTKVDQTDEEIKKYVMWGCSTAFHECMKKNKSEHKGEKGGEKHEKPSKEQIEKMQQQMDEMMKCNQEALNKMKQTR